MKIPGINIILQLITTGALLMLMPGKACMQDAVAINTLDSDLNAAVFQEGMAIPYPFELAGDSIHYLLLDTAIQALELRIQQYDSLSEVGAGQESRIELALALLSNKNSIEALNYLDEAYDYADLRGDEASKGLLNTLIATALVSSGEADKAIPYLPAVDSLALVGDSLWYSTELLMTTKSALQRNGILTEPTNDDTLMTAPPETLSKPGYDGLIMLVGGQYFQARSQPEKAQYYLNSALQDDPHDASVLRDIYKNLADVHNAIGNDAIAYHYLKHYSILNDSLLNERRQRILNQLLVRMRFWDKQAEIRDLEKDRYIESVKSRGQNILTISLLIGLIIILMGTYLTIRNYQKRLSANQIIHHQNEEINHRRIVELENNLKIKTMHSMILGQEAERERVARDLHDSLGGLLSTVKLHFDALQGQMDDVSSSAEYNKAYGLLDEACKEVRSISNNMQPSALLRMGLVPAINDLVNRIKSDETPAIDFQHYGVNGALDQTAGLNVYRIVQELLNNSVKHASASHILVQLIQKDDELIVMVEDDGVGYDIETFKTGMGTANIASRVDFLKGELSIQTKPGEGTTTLINIPLS